MKIKKYVLLAVVLLVPGVSSGEIVQLKDGSTLVGKLIKIQNDSIYVLTSFGARVAISKRLIKTISFLDSIETSKGDGANLFSSSDPGSLHVLLGDIVLSSKISVHRERGRSQAETANSIEEAFYVDNVRVFSFVDSSMDKLIRKGPDQIIKNNISLRNIKLSLAPGPHSCRLVVRNIGGRTYGDSFEPEPLDEEVDLGNIMVYPGKTTRIEIEKKRSKFGLGGSSLRLKK